MGLAFQNLGRQFCSPKYTIVNILYTLLTVTALNILESYTTQDDNALKQQQLRSCSTVSNISTLS